MIATILGWIGSFFGAFFGVIINSIAAWAGFILDICVYFLKMAIHDFFMFLQLIILGLIQAANVAANLLPSCNAVHIDTTAFLQTYNSTGQTIATVACWVIPFGILSTMLLCMIQAVMAYFVISWVFRWLKIIK